MGFGMTELGRCTYALVNAYDLGQFYQVEVGNLVIQPCDFTVEVLYNITRFLKNNTGWVMGYEFVDTDDYVVYVTQIDSLN